MNSPALKSTLYFLMLSFTFLSCDIFESEEECVTTINLENPVDEEFILKFVSDTGAELWSTSLPPLIVATLEMDIASDATGNYTVELLRRDGSFYSNTDVVTIVACQENAYAVDPSQAIDNTGCDEEYAGPNDPNAVQRDVFCQQAWSLVCAGLATDSPEVQTACNLYNELSPSGGPTCPYCQ